MISIDKLLQGSNLVQNFRKIWILTAKNWGHQWKPPKKSISLWTIYRKIMKKKVMNATKSVLYYQHQIWIKINNNNKNKLFEVSVGGKHGAEICKITGI